MDQTYTETRTAEELLAELLTSQKRTERRSLIRMIAGLLVLAAVISASFIIVPHMISLIDNVQTSLTQMNDTVNEAEELIRNANTMITENSETISEAVKKLNEIDFKKLNDAISALNDVVTPLANLFR